MALIVFKWPEIVSMGIISWELESDFLINHRTNILRPRKYFECNGICQVMGELD